MLPERTSQVTYDRTTGTATFRGQGGVTRVELDENAAHRIACVFHARWEIDNTEEGTDA